MDFATSFKRVKGSMWVFSCDKKNLRVGLWVLWGQVWGVMFKRGGVSVLGSGGGFLAAPRREW